MGFFQVCLWLLLTRVKLRPRSGPLLQLLLRLPHPWQSLGAIVQPDLHPRPHSRPTATTQIRKRKTEAIALLADLNFRTHRIFALEAGISQHQGNGRMEKRSLLILIKFSRWDFSIGFVGEFGGNRRKGARNLHMLIWKPVKGRPPAPPLLWRCIYIAVEMRGR